MQKRTLLTIIILLLAFANIASAQESNPEIKSESEVELIDTSYHHSPKLATWLSFAVPGAGQFYNKKYWKIPVIYILGGALVYTTISNNRGYYKYKDAYIHLYENPDEPMEGFELYSLDDLKSIKEQYRRYRDLSLVGLLLLYTLNIIDATVDGYLFDYDVSDDLSLRIEPNIMNSYYQTGSLKASQQYGFKLSLRF
jgi:hypothetical protein